MRKATADNITSVLAAIRKTRRGARLVYWRTSGASLQLADCAANNGGVLKYLDENPERMIGVYSNCAKTPPPTQKELTDDINASLREMPA